jgi:hypothetical protein
MKRDSLVLIEVMLDKHVYAKKIDREIKDKLFSWN